MAVFQVEASRVSDLRLPFPILLGHGDQAPLLERAGGESELGGVRRDGVGSVPDAGEECELPVV
jgi:poly(3-hydroxybutyrate) depolymerase